MEEKSLSDDDTEIFDDLEQLEGRRGLRPGRQNCSRDFEAAHQQMLNDYFSGTPVYKEYQFERRFGMPRTIFNRIYDELKVANEFSRKYNPVTRCYGIHTRVRFCAALQLLVSGDPFDSVD